MRQAATNFSRHLTRRKMLEMTAAAAFGALLAGCGGGEVPSVAVPPENTPAQPKNTEKNPSPKVPPENTPTQPEITKQSAETKTPTTPAAGQAYMAVARGADPAAITEAALKAIGGIERFVKKGADVIIKPNICTDYYPFEYGATTNPEVVGALVRLALGAGAARVRIMDTPFGGSAKSAYIKSGISDAVKAAGGEMVVMNINKYRATKIPNGQSIKDWPIYQDVLNCDLLIDVPIAKHHGLAQMTAAQKNLMGVIQRRSAIHAEMGQRIPDLVSVIRPGLIVVDAIRTLMTNGPSGGNLDDVKINNTVFATHDIVAADAYAATFFGLTGNDIPYIKNAAAMGLGTLDLTSIDIEEINV